MWGCVSSCLCAAPRDPLGVSGMLKGPFTWFTTVVAVMGCGGEADTSGGCSYTHWHWELINKSDSPGKILPFLFTLKSDAVQVT